MEDFTSKKTQIVSGNPVIKKVFRMREGGVVIEESSMILPGTLIGLKRDGSISAYPLDPDRFYDFDNEDYIPLGFTIDFVTPEKPQAALMTWGIINPKAYKEAFGDDFPIPPIFSKGESAIRVSKAYALLMSYGIVVTLESDGVEFPPIGR